MPYAATTFGSAVSYCWSSLSSPAAAVAHGRSHFIYFLLNPWNQGETLNPSRSMQWGNSRCFKCLIGRWIVGWMVFWGLIDVETMIQLWSQRNCCGSAIPGCCFRQFSLLWFDGWLSLSISISSQDLESIFTRPSSNHTQLNHWHRLFGTCWDCIMG